MRNKLVLALISSLLSSGTTLAAEQKSVHQFNLTVPDSPSMRYGYGYGAQLYGSNYGDNTTSTQRLLGYKNRAKKHSLNEEGSTTGYSYPFHGFAPNEYAPKVELSDK